MKESRLGSQRNDFFFFFFNSTVRESTNEIYNQISLGYRNLQAKGKREKVQNMTNHKGTELGQGLVVHYAQMRTQKFYIHMSLTLECIQFITSLKRILIISISIPFDSQNPREICQNSRSIPSHSSPMLSQTERRRRERQNQKTG